MGNGETPKWLGVGIDKWVTMFSGVGLPSVLILFGCFLGMKYVPPVVDGHVDLLNTTRDTLIAMEKTLEQSHEILSKLANQRHPEDDFRNQVAGDHSEAQQSLDAIQSDVQHIRKKIGE